MYLKERRENGNKKMSEEVRAKKQGEKERGKKVELFVTSETQRCRNKTERRTNSFLAMKLSRLRCDCHFERQAPYVCNQKKKGLVNER